MTRITHELRFILGIYPIGGWLTGIEIHTCYPSWYIHTTITIFLIWALYESIINYIQNGEPKLILIMNALGVASEIDLIYLISRNFPIVSPTGTLYIAGYVYLVIYLIVGVIVNIMDLKRK